MITAEEARMDPAVLTLLQQAEEKIREAMGTGTQTRVRYPGVNREMIRIVENYLRLNGKFKTSMLGFPPPDKDGVKDRETPWTFGLLIDWSIGNHIDYSGKGKPRSEKSHE